MYFIPFRKIFQSHSAGFHKKEDRKEGTERKASSPSAPPFLLPHGSMLFHKIGWVDRLSILEYLKVQVGAFYAVIYRGLA